MASYSTYTLAELNTKSLEHFIYQPVNKTMISFLADAAFNVIVCDATLKPTPIPSLKMDAPASTDPQRVRSDDCGLPSLHEFITQLVCASNVQVPTLMSTLVYLNRLRSRLQPMARGLRCTTHRIFLAALILAAKYLNDSSPRCGHWARYSNMHSDVYNFGFSRTEVNLMEKQLLYLLDWDLRIQPEDLYRELDPFLEPIRQEIELKYARRMHRRRVAHEEQLRQLHQQQQQAAAVAAAVGQPPVYIAGISAPSPAVLTSVLCPATLHSNRNNSYSSTSSIGSAYSMATTSSSRVPSLVSADSNTPNLGYSSTEASPESNMAVSRITTPTTFGVPSSSSLSSAMAMADSYMGDNVVVVGAADASAAAMIAASRSRKTSSSSMTSGRLMLPYDAVTAGPDELHEMQEDLGKTKKLRLGRNVLGRVFGAVSVR